MRTGPALAAAALTMVSACSSDRAGEVTIPLADRTKVVWGGGIALTAGCTSVTFTGDPGRSYTLTLDSERVGQGDGSITWTGGPSPAGHWFVSADGISFGATDTIPEAVHGFAYEGCSAA